MTWVVCPAQRSFPQDLAGILQHEPAASAAGYSCEALGQGGFSAKSFAWPAAGAVDAPKSDGRVSVLVDKGAGFRSSTA